jgi:ABC-type multidrug transport system permease subunit
MRSRQFIAVVTCYLVLLGIVLAVFLIQHGGSLAGRSSQLGIELFQALSIFQLVLIFIVTPASTAGSISGERQQQTWDLLLVTRLSTFDILLGKLLAGVATNAVLIAASLPLLAAVFFFGGVGIGDVIRTYAVFLGTILLLAATSLFISALTRRPTVSMIVSIAVSLVLGVGISLAVIAAEVNADVGGLGVVGELGSLPPGMAPLPPPAQLDPVVGLLSALPAGGDGTMLGDLGTIHHAFGLPLVLQMWVAFLVLTLVIAAVLLGLSTALMRFGLPHLRPLP